MITVQIGSAILAGLTNAGLTNPLDVVKTRLQVADPATRPTFMKTASALTSIGLCREPSNKAEHLAGSRMHE